eukprot:6220646-Pyramimonas_sp.AAC.2
MAARPVPFLLSLSRGFATKRSGFRSGRTTKDVAVVAQANSVAKADEWTEVKDETSGQIYFWNQHTNETTALGEPKPGPEGRIVPQQQGGQSVGLGGMVAAGAGEPVLSPRQSGDHLFVNTLPP